MAEDTKKLIEEAEKELQQALEIVQPAVKEGEDNTKALAYYQALQDIPPLQRALFRQVTPLAYSALCVLQDILLHSRNEKIKADVAQKILSYMKDLLSAKESRINQTNINVNVSRLTDDELDKRLRELEEQLKKAEEARKIIDVEIEKEKGEDQPSSP